MSRRTKTQSHRGAERWPSAKEIMSQPGAERALERLEACGADPETIVDRLQLLVYGMGYRDAVTVPGLPWYTLRRFPERVRDLAKTLDTLHMAGIELLLGPKWWRFGAALASRRGRPDVHLSVPRNPRADMELSFPSKLDWDSHATRCQAARVSVLLPPLLRFYADFLEHRLKIQGRENRRAPMLESLHKLRFIEYLRRTTGASHYGELSTLICAATNAVGLSEVCTPKNLEMLWARNPRLRWVVRRARKTRLRRVVPGQPSSPKQKPARSPL